MYWAKPVKDVGAMGFEGWLDVTTGRKAISRGDNKVGDM
jgi:hypothetical protein